MALDTIVKIKHGIHFGKKSGAVMQVTKAVIEPDAMPNAATGGKDWAIWGADNNFPQRIVDENVQDPTSAPALGFKIKAHYGLGPYLFKRRTDGDKEIITHQQWEAYPEIDEFRYQSDLENTLEGLITDFEWWNICYTQMILNKTKNKVLQINRIPTINARKAKLDKRDGKVKKIFVSGAWPEPKSNEFVELNVFDRSDPFRFPNAVYIHTQPSVDKLYYPSATWLSNQQWLGVARKIAPWILSNIDNSINLKYHIKIPEEYFLNLYPKENYDSDEAWHKALVAAETDLKTDMDNFLAGSDNAMKSFYSKFAIDQDGKPIPGFEIVAITNDIKDEAWLRADSTAAARIASAHSVPPDLVGLILSGNSSGGSGSNVREQFNHYVQMHTVIPRQTTLEWWEIVKRVNKWPADLHLGYRNIILQTVDNAKGGFQKEGESNSTTTNKQ